MSFGNRLVHELVHVATPLSGTDDEYGQPVPGTPVQTTIRGLVQPRTVREMADSRSIGSEIADHVIFLLPMRLSSADHFVYDGDRYDIAGIRSYEFGRTPHFEVDAVRVLSSDEIEEGS